MLKWFLSWAPVVVCISKGLFRTSLIKLTTYKVSATDCEDLLLLVCVNDISKYISSYHNC